VLRSLGRLGRLQTGFENAGHRIVVSSPSSHKGVDVHSTTNGSSKKLGWKETGSETRSARELEHPHLLPTGWAADGANISTVGRRNEVTGIVAASRPSASLQGSRPWSNQESQLFWHFSLSNYHHTAHRSKYPRAIIVLLLLCIIPSSDLDLLLPQFRAAHQRIGVACGPTALAMMAACITHFRSARTIAAGRL
jgi:hypothetical protein